MAHPRSRGARSILLTFAAVSTVLRHPCASSLAGDEVPPLAVHPQTGVVESEPPRHQEEPRPEKLPRAPLVEVTGEFTQCTASHLLRLEVARRISEVDPGRSSGGRWTEYSSTLAFLARLDRSLADCSSEERETALQVWRLFRTAVEYPDLRRAAVTKAPLTIATAARAAQMLNGVEHILRSRQLGVARGPCKTDASCETELQRREDLLTRALRQAP